MDTAGESPDQTLGGNADALAECLGDDRSGSRYRCWRLGGLGLVLTGHPFPRGTADQPASPLAVLKIALSVVAGIGGVVALTIAYRRQRDLEAIRFGERFAAASAQLGGSAAAIRIAGTYAMAALADEYPNNARQQQCIDALCAYLRLPCHAGPQDGLLETAVISRTHTDASGITLDEQRTYRAQPQEREVRLTIISIIRDRLLSDTGPWHDRNFDFTGAIFDGGDFSEAHFSGEVSFAQAEFSGVSFAEAEFRSGRVSFILAEFSGGWVSFAGAKFSGGRVSFIGAEFSGGVVNLSSPRSWRHPPVGLPNEPTKGLKLPEPTTGNPSAA